METIIKTKKRLGQFKYMIYIPILGSIIASLSLFLITSIKLIWDIYYYGIVSFRLDLTKLSVSIISALDSYLLAVIVYIFALCLYDLFIGGIDMPTWLKVHNLDDLKKKLSSVIALILAVLFLKHVIAWENGKETLYFAISITIMIGALIAYMLTKENLKLK